MSDFSLTAHLFQAVFQRSVVWYRKSMAAIEALDALAVLREPPPRR